MLDPQALIESHVYFLLGYRDRDFRVPFIETYFYRGRHSAADTALVHHFELAASGNAGSDVPGLVLDDEGLETMFDWKGLLEELSDNLEMQKLGKTLGQKLPRESKLPGSN